MKLKARKAGARTPLETELLLRDFEQDFSIVLGRAFWATKVSLPLPVADSRGRASDRDRTSPKRARVDSSSGSRPGLTHVKTESDSDPRQAKVNETEEELAHQAELEAAG